MTSPRLPRSLGLPLVLLLVVAFLSVSEAAAVSSVCISRYGQTVVQRGSARCESDSTSVAIVRGDNSYATASNHGRATVSGSSSEAHAHDFGGAIVNGDRSSADAAGQDNIATVNGTGSEAVATNGNNNVASVVGNFSNAFAGNGDNNVATVSGDESDALAGNGNNNKATINGDMSQAAAQAPAGCDAVVAVDNGAESCP